MEVAMDIEKQFQEKFNGIFSRVGTESLVRYMRFFISVFKLRILEKKGIVCANRDETVLRICFFTSGE